MTTPDSRGASGSETARLLVLRDRHYLGFLSRVKVLLDGSEAGKLGLDESLLRDVTPGLHQVRVGAGLLMRSRAIELSLTAGTTTRLRCRFRGNLVTANYWGMFAPRRALILEIVDEQGRSSDDDTYRDIPDRAPVVEWLRRRRDPKRPSA